MHILSVWLTINKKGNVMLLHGKIRAHYVPRLHFFLGLRSGYTSTSRHYVLKPRCYRRTNESCSFLVPSVCFLSVKSSSSESYYLLRWEKSRKRGNGVGWGEEGRKEGRKMEDSCCNKNFCLISTQLGSRVKKQIFLGVLLGQKPKLKTMKWN